ncbi:hypothetical protein JTB14_032279 [Gonioctena quinquepunctata]|nr:hypothetical protein JTB14_032279 [Gonioctena quinquepunctata]
MLADMETPPELECYNRQLAKHNQHCWIRMQAKGMISSEMKNIEQSENLLETVDVKITKGPIFGKRHWQILCLFLMMVAFYGMKMHFSLTLVAMMDPNTSSNGNIPTYKWTNRGVILSSFLWGYIVLQIAAGWLVTFYGAKWLLILSIGLESTFGLLIPTSASWFGYEGVLTCRILQGMTAGCIYPGLKHLMAQWVPPNERARMESVLQSGIILILMI